MAMMQVFPNMVNFDKQTYGYEHYLVSSNSPWDLNNDGNIDAGQPFLFDMLSAANMGLRKFQGFNTPMGLPPDYEWYPAFDAASQLVTMKEPDGSLMKMFLQMQAAGLPAAKKTAFLAALANYPAYSNGVTLGGHGVLPKGKALGAGQNGCHGCHGEAGVLALPIPVDRKVLTQVNNMQVELPLYQWKYYNMRGLVDLGVRTQDEDVVAGRADIDIDGDSGYVRTSPKSFVLNWFAPSATYIAADDKRALDGTGLTTNNLTWNGGEWMPVLEPVVDYVPNYAVLGYQRSEVIWPRGRMR